MPAEGLWLVVVTIISFERGGAIVSCPLLSLCVIYKLKVESMKGTEEEGGADNLSAFFDSRNLYTFHY